MSRSGIAELVAGATIISFSPVFVKLADVGPTTAGFYRCLFGGLLLVALVIVRRDRLWVGARPLALAGLCGVLFAADLTFWHRSILYIGPGLATICGNFQVFFLAAFGIIVLHEKVGWRYLVSIPMAITGLVMLVGVDWSRLAPSYKLGVFFGIATALAYAAYLLVLRKSQSQTVRLGATANLCVISLVTAALMGVEARIQGESYRIPDWSSGFSLVAYGFACQALAWIIISRALVKVQASRAGLVLLLQPALAFVWDVVLFSRRTDTVGAAGAALALAAIYLGGSRKRN